MLKNMTETEARVWANTYATFMEVSKNRSVAMTKATEAVKDLRALIARTDRLARKLQTAKAKPAPAPAPAPDPVPEPRPWREPKAWKGNGEYVTVDPKAPIKHLDFEACDFVQAQDAVKAYNWAAKQYRARIAELERVISELRKRGGK